MDTRNEILQTCLKHFLKHGIRKMSNEKLVALLGISTKTLYKHFRDKEGLLEEVLHLYHDQRYEMLQKLPLGQPAVSRLFDTWHHAIHTEPKVSEIFYEDLRYYYPQLADKVESSISKKFSDAFVQIIEAGIAEKSFRADIIPGLVLEGIYAIYVTIVRKKHHLRFSATLTDAYLNTMVVYFRGFCTPKGMEILDKHISESITGRPGLRESNAHQKSITI